jgi:protein TonB
LAHIAIIVIVARGTIAVHKLPAEVPLVVALIPVLARPPQELTLPRPTVAFPGAIPVPTPEYQLPPDHLDVVATTVPVAAIGQRLSEASSTSPDTTPNLQVMSTVAYAQRPAPTYPRESRLAREEGLVILRVLIDESGRARDIDVYRSSGHPRLDKEACAAVVRALFKPYVDGGVARPAIALVPIEFSLPGKSS